MKTYPTISREYSELVCTAGLRPDGSWIRIYPVPFRRLFNQYKKYQWVTIDLIPNRSDKRQESFRPTNLDAIELQDVLGTTDSWRERKRFVIEKGKVYEDLDELIQLNKNGELSLATFRPARIHDLICEASDREWDPNKLRELELKSKQSDMFDDSSDLLRIVDKLPYKFSYRFDDQHGKTSTMMIEDWEIGMLYWNCLKRHEGDEAKAIADVRKKYIDDFAQNKELHFFLGTTLQYDGWASNPFIIIGTFTPPIMRQKNLF